MAKKIIALLVCIACIALLVCACNTNKKNDGSKDLLIFDETEAYDLKFKLLQDYSGYLWASDYLYGDILWAISYIEDFLETRSWDDLLKARTALRTAEMYIEQRSMPEDVATNDDINKLTAAGYDVSFMLLNRANNDAEKYTFLTSTIPFLESGLYDYVFSKNTSEIFKQYVETLKEYCQLSIRFINAQTKYLMLDLKDDVLTEKMDTYILNGCKTMLEYTEKLPETAQELEETAAGYTIQLDESIGSLSEIVGALNADLYLLEENHDYSSLISTAAQITGIPTQFPAAPWDDGTNGTYMYFYMDENGSSIYPKEQEELDRAPYGFMLTFNDVDEEEFIKYKNTLSEFYKMTVYKDEVTDGMYDISYIVDEKLCLLQWQNGTVTFYTSGEPTGFAPWWYAEGLFNGDIK